MKGPFFIDTDEILDVINESKSVWYIHKSSNENGFSFKHTKGRFDLIRSSNIIPTLSNRNHLMVFWSFHDASGSTQLVNDAELDDILSFIEDKVGMTIEDISLGNITRE